MIASRLGVKSLQALFRSYKAFRELAFVNEFWRKMLVVRFGIGRGTADKLRQPRWAYMHLYYIDYKNCDEVGKSYYRWCGAGLANYYLVTSDVSLEVGIVGAKPLSQFHLPDTYDVTAANDTLRQMSMSSLQALVSWGFWFGSVQRLVDLFRAIKPEDRKWDTMALRLTLPPDRRAIVREAIVLYSGVTKPNDKYKLVEKASYGMHEPDRYNVYSRLMDFVFDPYPDRPSGAVDEKFPDDWLTMIDSLTALEKAGRWVGNFKCIHHLPIAINNLKYRHLCEDITARQYDRLVLAIEQAGSDLFFKVINTVF